ncbi:MFS family permease [Streptosporangium becharense]|uniref:MFS family permease n=1 Tax=Streptosporangium becharense TaxID=1816182 RepID=A0A7W9MKN9_9ACTN|nr:MFS transporter [Streptosporangium becharense]MBB2915375.1 MFS family permease [Streptosporangium becharense]MBB5823739.1 MFS family permease [Streptosporangium becharense]
MSAPAAKTTLPRLALAGIFGGLFCGYVGLTAAIPVLPGFVRERFGATDFAVGLVVTATALTALLVRPISGHLADRHGHRRVMQLGALIVAAGGALYFLPLGLPALVLVRLLLGVGEASLFTAGAVWIVSIAPHERRGQLIGLYGVSMWGGISVGTFLGAAMLPFGYGAVWGFSVAVALAGLVLITSAPVRPRAGQPDGGQPGGERQSGGHGLLVRPALLPGTALGLAAAGYAGLAAFVVLHLQARGVDSGVVVLSGFSIVYAGTRLFIGHLPDRLGARRVAAWSGAGEAAGLLIIALAPNLPVAVLGSLVMGVGFSLLHPSLALMVMDRTDPAKQGAAIGAYTSFWDLGLTIWGPLIGVVAAGFGYPAVFVAGAACAAAAVVVALCVPRPGPQPTTAT